MFQRLKLILESLKTNKRLKESDVSTTIDDTKEGSRITFSRDRVQDLLIKCGLLEPIDDTSNSRSNEEKPIVKDKHGQQ